VAFAAIKAIGDIMMMLPMRTQLLLKCFGIGEVHDILKFIDTNDELHIFFLCYIFR
jgi:hypothetical protein